MKRSILILVAIFSFSVLFTACKETKKENVETEFHENQDYSSEKEANNSVYQCPMDCEDGKTYDAKGTCPVCKMDLKMAAKE
ncbi:hypothetical protein MHL31_07710 [Lutibacter sp. A80]|uniref:heavy metal-binding domain-containing protein n=1 Tax=Lutibacter sp. A80 TaxID=2918453 RepID=UPI001F052ED2|nr:heavy metal-binding domain-containing protein [Lutibacter sp. A80]UMB62070.1 hypothetical protein MHL31_07710 [Lutibacter sp. A80]